MGKPVQEGLYLASIGSFDAGMNSDVPAVALPLNQLAFAENCTVRGNFVTHRSPYQKITLLFDNVNEQTAFEGGRFQGACYYKPDTGAEQIIASINGKFYAVTPAATVATVEDISAPTDNPSDLSQAWLWQGESFVFINDGQSVTAIYNGAETFRAKQGELIATIASTWTIPSEGLSVAITFTAPYTGPFNTPLYAYSGSNLLGTFEVNTESSSGGYLIRLTNVDDTPGTTQPTGSDVKIINSWTGVSVTAGTPTTYNDGFWGVKNTMQQNGQPGAGASVEYQRQTVTVDPPYTAGVGKRIRWPGIDREIGGDPISKLETIVTQVFSGGTSIKVDRDDGPSSNNLSYVSIPAGATAVLMNAQPDVLLGKTTADFVAPAAGASVDVPMDRLVVANGQVVTINGVHYTATVPPPVSTTTLFLKTIGTNKSGNLQSSGATLQTIPQLPPGRMGAYGLGRNWISLLDGQSYLGSDIVGSSSGSIAYNFRDSILNVSENNYLAGGGVFRVPSAGQQIAAMAFPATLDSSLGQGPLQVLTQDVTFSCNAPVQRSDWQTLTNPIQTQSLVGGGALGYYSCVAVNGDLWFRSDDGIRSLKLARQEFGVSYSNTPQSVEMNRVLINDNRSLLQYGSAIVFDNRLLMTASPTSSNAGTYHPNIIALNLDPNSSLRVKQPPVYDGVWQGINVLQLITGTFAGIKRAFAFHYDIVSETIQLIEIKTTKNSNQFDDDNTRIQWSFETPAIFYQSDTQSRQLRKLADGEIFVKDLKGTVQFLVQFRPDWLDEWTTWHEWEVSDNPNFQPRMGLGTPPITGDDTTGRPNCVGYFFQLRISILGSCTFMGSNLFASAQPVTSMAPPIASEGLIPLTT